MIAYLKGKLVRKEPSYAIIDVNGIGYEVRISLSTYEEIGNSELCQLQTYLHVKEDAHTLYGFISDQEKAAFIKLISVNGIGPNTGITILSYMNVEELTNAIVSGNVQAIQAVKGIGGKTAQRVILELKDKFGDIGTAQVGNISMPSRNTIKKEALDALMALGFAKAAAEKSIDNVLKKEGHDIKVEELIKLSLKQK